MYEQHASSNILLQGSLLLSASRAELNSVRVLKDAMELDQLISYFINKEDSEGVILIGHSTGCQVSKLSLWGTYQLLLLERLNFIIVCWLYIGYCILSAYKFRMLQSGPWSYFAGMHLYIYIHRILFLKQLLSHILSLFKLSYDILLLNCCSLESRPM